MKKQIVEYKDSIHYELEGPIEDAIEYLQRVKRTNPDKKFTISWEQGDYEDADRMYLYLCTMRDETDEEYEARLTNVAIAQAKRDECDKAQYEMLKAKFEKQS